MSGLTVHHFGPDPATVGGMASVIRVLTDHGVGGDIVDCHPTWRPEPRLGNVRLVAEAARVLVKMPRGDVVHVHLSEGGSFVREGALVRLASRLGHVTAVTIHGADFMPFAERFPRLVGWVLRGADVITCLDQETLDYVSGAAPRARCVLMANPIYVADRFVPADESEELVVFAGDVGLRKGADILHRAWLEVAQRRPRARCLMVGPVTDFAPPPAERLEVRPAVDPREMTSILTAARVVVLPSRAERMPMVLTEAMSLARPFVSTPVGGIPELAAEGGVLVPVGDADGLADSLTEMLAEPGLARTVGERGRQFCVETRSVEVIGATLRELYSTAASERLAR